jgi:tetratricopeptide (TPR) repeat protein
MIDRADDRHPPGDESSRSSPEKSQPSNTGRADISLPNEVFQPSSLSAHAPVFVTGDLLAKRFRIVRFLGRGGMGEVYEAEDLELEEHVAIKVLSNEIASSPDALDRFKREIQLARKVTHPNVCRTFDLIRQDPSDTGPRIGSRPIAFLTMELLQGESLAAALRRKGRFAPAELLPLARQMAEALEAVHRSGIVHQDFKPGNVMLVESESQAAPRAIVSDFGLAQSVASGSRSASQSSGGTPDYMAPEQVLGAPPTVAADVFSFGVVLYEAITGRLPFPARSREEAAQKRLTEAPVPPSRFAPDVPADWERVILRCLAREPKDRYASPLAAIHELEKSGHRVGAIVAAGVVCIAIAGYIAWHFLRPPAAPRVAVVNPRNATGDPQFDWLSTEIADTLSTYLQSGPKLQVVPRDDVVRTLDDFSIPPNEDMAKDNIAPFREALGASFLILGSYHSPAPPAEAGAGEIHVSLRLQGARGETIDAFEKSGPVQDVDAITQQAAAEFRRALGQAKPPAAEEDAIYPRDADARRLYFQGLAELRSFNRVEGLESLKQAEAHEEKNPLIHSAIADALSMLRRDMEAAKEAQKASDLALQNASLPQEYVLVTKAHAAEMNHQWQSARELYESLCAIDPQRLNYGLKLASVETSGSQPSQALETLDRLSRLPKPIGQDPRISIERARAFAARADYPGAIEAANSALEFAKARKARLMEADAQIELCGAYRNLGKVEDAMRACDDAEKTFSVFGDQAAAAVATNGMANWLADRGSYSEAKQDYDRVAAIQEKNGASKDLAGALLNSAKMSIYLGKPDEAEPLLQKSLTISGPIEDKNDEAIAHLQLADIAYGRGDLASSEKEAQAAAALALEIDDRSTRAFALSALALAKSENGDLPGALNDYRETLSIRESLGEQGGIAKAKSRIGDVYARMGDATAAERNFQEAIALDDKLQQRGDAAQDRLLLAELDLERGPVTGVEDTLATITKVFHDEGDSDSEKDALSVSVRLLVQEKKLDQVAARLDEMKKLDSDDLDVRLDAALAEGTLLAATREPQKALAVLNAAAEDAEKSGRRYANLRIRLLAAQVDAESGDSTSARKEFAAIHTAAERFGFKRIAEESAAMPRASAR